MTEVNTLTALALPTLDQAVEYYLLVDLADKNAKTVAWNKARLDHLTTLGVDGIWLNPCYPSPGADHGRGITPTRCSPTRKKTTA